MTDEVKDTLLTPEDEQQTEEQEEDTQETQEQEEEGQQEKSWRDELLPDDLKGLPLFEKYQSPQEALKAFAEAQKLIGKKGFIPPDKDASEEEKKEFLRQVSEALGAEIPKSPDEYELPEVVDLPDDLPVEDELVNGFKETAHKLGLNKEQVKELYSWYMQSLAGSYNAQVEKGEQLMKEAETTLRQKWGKAYESKLASAQKFLNTFGTEGLKQKVASGWGNDPDLIETLANAAEKVSEDVISGTPKKSVMTPEEARQEIWKIKADPNHPFNDEGHPEHGLAQERMTELYKMAYPDLTEETVE